MNEEITMRTSYHLGTNRNYYYFFHEESNMEAGFYVAMNATQKEIENKIFLTRNNLLNELAF